MDGLITIAERFATGAPVVSVVPFGSGLINDTYLVRAGEGGFVLQRVNPRVFPAPERIIANLAVLSEHLTRHGDPGLRLPALIPAADGAPWVRDAEGVVWRLMTLIPDARALPRVETDAEAAEVGRVLGTFHRLVSDLPAERLAITLPGFHDTPAYLERFTQVLQHGGGFCHTPEVRAAIREVAAGRAGVEVLEMARRQRRLPERVTHGDPKLDNILFDLAGRRALSLVDLDTVQPGLWLQDLGDCVRSCCNRRGEAPGGEPAAELDLGLFAALLGAYAEETRSLLAPVETALVYEAVRLVPFELGLRFLTDHLEGDRYFRVSAPGENLAKARVQLALAADVARKERAIRALASARLGSGGWRR
jgi:Ser/Thr protein kinase RdoA (MazF antagonist)